MAVTGDDRSKVFRFLQEVAESEHPQRSYNRGALDLICAELGFGLEREGLHYVIRDPEVEAANAAAKAEAEEREEAERVAAAVAQDKKRKNDTEAGRSKREEDAEAARMARGDGR